MLILLAGIEFLLKFEELTLPAVISVSSAPIQKHSGMLSSIPGSPKKWTTSKWNQWTTSTGIGGQHRMEWLDNFKWIGWTTSTGARNHEIDEAKSIIEDWWKARPVLSQLPFAMEAIELLDWQHPSREAPAHLWL
jgi:hypothetical protein